MIRSLQEYYVHKGLVEIAFSLLSKQSTQVLTEVLALLCCLLFNANTSVQVGQRTRYCDRSNHL